MNEIISEQPILTFINSLITYLNGKFSSESKLSANKRPSGHLAFSNDLIKNATKSFFVVKCISHSIKDETFNSPATLNVYIQIDVYAQKGSYNNAIYLAEPMSIILQQLISNYLNELKYGGSNANIRLMRQMSSSPAFPFEDGAKAFQSSLRYEFTIMNDYLI